MPQDSAARTYTAPEPRATFGAWWMLGVLTLCYILSFVDRQVMSILLQDIKTNLDLTDFQLSLLAGPAFGFAYGLFGLPLGWAADRMSRRWVVFGGVVIWSLATMACGLAAGFLLLFLARAMVGFGEAALTPSAYSLIGDRFPTSRRGTALAIYHMAPKLGKGAAYWATALAIGLTIAWVGVEWPLVGPLESWRLVFVVLGAAGLPVAFLVLTFAEPARRNVVRFEGEAQPRLLPFLAQNKLLLTLLIAGFSVVAVLGGSLVWVPAFVTRTYGLTPVQYGPALGLVSVLAGFSLIGNGLLVDWLYRRGIRDVYVRFYTWLLAVMVFVMAGAYFVESPWVFFALYGVMQAIALPFMFYVSATVQMIAPNELRGRLSALFLFVVTLSANGGGPLVVASLTDFVFKDPTKVGWSLAITGSAACAISFVLLRLALRPLRRRLAADDPGPAATLVPAAG